VLTATSLYSLYPKSLARRETVRGMTPVYIAEIQRLTLRGLQLVGANTQRIAPCDEACLPVWRRTETLEGIGIMRWGGYDGTQNDEGLQSFIDDVGFSNHKWRLGLQCFNSACQNSSNITLI
jgi:hypothetical protein